MLKVNKKVCHPPTLPKECCAYCTGNGPDTLLDLCIEYILNYIETICETEPYTGNLTLREHIALPIEICERILYRRSTREQKLNSQFVNIFKNLQATKLRRVNLHNTDIDDDSIRVLLSHNLTSLEVSDAPYLTFESLGHIAKYGENLTSLTIGENTNVFSNELYAYFINKQRREVCVSEYLILPLRLKRLSIRTSVALPPLIFIFMLKTLTQLTHLDLSNCSDLSDFTYARELINLRSLILYNVNTIELMIPIICQLKNLQHLDISQSRIENGRWEKNGTKILQTIVESLPKLTSLDISGTNLAGTGVAEYTGEAHASDIPGLSSRVKNPFQFLGLYETQKDACYRHDIPALMIAGNATEEQMLIAAMAYMDRHVILQKVLNDIFHLFRFGSCKYYGQALNVILTAMNKHLTEKHIQISGSASLFHIVKSAGKELHGILRLKRKVITALLNGMSVHRNDDTMMRNGCLVLCQFKVPLDVVFDYERLVELLLHSVYGMPQESFVQRIGIYLLNTVACQVDGQQKIKLGELGAVNKMLWLIAERLKRGICDDVLEVAWSTMWNVTDETPLNCQIFLELKGMEYFLECLQKFYDRDELLRNMMGLLGNVAEVHFLRSNLMTKEYITVFSQLLESVSDGIEVGYNAAGVISHIASDGPEAWTIDEPRREDVLARMTTAIGKWNLRSQRNINYRSFEPILYLVSIHHTPECQHWAVWALANLTSVYPEKYCHVLEEEGGITLLEDLLSRTVLPSAIRRLAEIVLQNCMMFNVRSSDVLQFDG
ncbi:protein zer-1 homolog isoform X2 [Onthophagus taurus]|nr:protein zer-1 homolog isoform X2 [Onthophagus taurus]